VFADAWEDNLRHSPEFASSIGDKRYNDQLSRLLVKAYNEGLEREQGFLMRLAAIDPSGFTAQETISRDLLLRQFAEDQEASEFKEWEMPLNQMGAFTPRIRNWSRNLNSRQSRITTTGLPAFTSFQGL